MPGRTFVCEAPGAPADPLGRWWYENNMAPIGIRRQFYMRRGPTWTVFCRPCERPIRWRRTWSSAFEAASQHLAWHRRRAES